jgi:hypothetical protein
MDGGVEHHSLPSPLVGEGPGVRGFGAVHDLSFLLLQEPAG